MNRINIFRNKSLKSAMLGSFLLGSFAFSHLQAIDSSLIEAVSGNNLDKVRQLLDSGANPNETDDMFGYTALWGAQTPEMINLLCEKGANINQQNRYGDTILFDTIAVPHPSRKLVKALLANDADPDIKDQKDHSPRSMVQLAIGSGIVYNGRFTSVSVDDKGKKIHGEVLELFNKRKIGKSQFRMSPLHEAVLEDDMGKVSWLLGKGAEVDARDKSGNTPLHLATNPDIINALCEKGADVNSRNKYGNTPLHSILFSDPPDPECVKILLKRKADKFAENQQKVTPVELARQGISLQRIYNGEGFRIEIDDAAREKYVEILALFFCDSPTRKESGASLARSTAVVSDRAFLQPPAPKKSGTSSVPSGVAVSDRAFLQPPTPKKSGASLARSAVAASDGAFLQPPTPKKSGTSSVPMAAAASDRPVSRLLNRSANFGGIGKPGTLSRDTTAQKALPKGKQQPAKSMGRSARALRSKPLAAGVRGKTTSVQRTRRAVPVQKRAVPTVSTVNHSGDYGL